MWRWSLVLSSSLLVPVDNSQLLFGCCLLSFEWRIPLASLQKQTTTPNAWPAERMLCTRSVCLLNSQWTARNRVHLCAARSSIINGINGWPAPWSIVKESLYASIYSLFIFITITIISKNLYQPDGTWGHIISFTRITGKRINSISKQFYKMSKLSTKNTHMFFG